MKTHLRSLLFAAAVLIGATGAFAADVDSAFVDTVVPAYLEVHQALAKDNLNAAHAAAAKLQTAAGTGAADLAAAAAAISEAADLAAARMSFAKASSALSALVGEAGAGGEQSLYLVHCPMAFSGKGGDWLQGTNKVSNPYLGGMMPACGVVKSQVAGEGSSAGTASGHH